jgi:hypothetical protein
VSRGPIWSASIGAEGIELAPYDFPGSSFYPRGLCRWQDVREIHVPAWPPEARTESEVLFVPATLREPLEGAAAAHRIPIVPRIDVWSLILEPFLDTEHDEAWREQTYASLSRCAIDRATCDAIREELEPAMMAYNFDSMLWDWTHLGLCDALLALRGELSGRRHRLPDDEFAAFYRRAMDLALRGAPLGT